MPANKQNMLKNAFFFNDPIVIHLHDNLPNQHIKWLSQYLKCTSKSLLCLNYSKHSSNLQPVYKYSQILTWRPQNIATISPIQLCRLYMLRMFPVLWKSNAATIATIARIIAVAFNPACMNFIRSLLHFQVQGNLYTIIADERRETRFQALSDNFFQLLIIMHNSHIVNYSKIQP